jgi:hypothetical protein
LTHGDGVTKDSVASNGFRIIAMSDQFVAGIEQPEKRIFGFQFHPEVDLTENGVTMFSNFLRRICRLNCRYTLLQREHKSFDLIRQSVGDKHVLVLCSGGVDSTVCAALCTKALGSERVHAIHIDNGFMRYNESTSIIKSLNEIGLNVNRFNFINEFLNARIIEKGGVETPPLKLVICPEQKRKIIGDTFILAIDHLKLDTDLYLVQGTLRPDLIESASQIASGCANVIKTHHNDSALVRELRDLVYFFLSLINLFLREKSLSLCKIFIKTKFANLDVLLAFLTILSIAILFQALVLLLEFFVLKDHLLMNILMLHKINFVHLFQPLALILIAFYFLSNQSEYKVIGVLTLMLLLLLFVKRMNQFLGIKFNIWLNYFQMKLKTLTGLYLSFMKLLLIL